MKIAFFLKPKVETIYIDIKSSVRQTIEKMEHHSYTAIPIISKSGKYIGTITEGDLLWYLKKLNFPDLRDLENIMITEVPLSVKNKSVSIHAEIEELFNLAVNQNFIPVVDDQGIYIGIVTRKSIMDFLYRRSYFAETISTAEFFIPISQIEV